MAEALDVQGIHIPMKVIVSFVTVDAIAISTTAGAIATAVCLLHHHCHHQHESNHLPNTSASENVRNPHKTLPSQSPKPSYQQSSFCSVSGYCLNVSMFKEQLAGGI
jgi:hypothetical protein